MNIQDTVVHIIGFLILWKLILPLTYLCFKYTYGKNYWSKRKQLRNAGEWAVITGASAGIGKAYAAELAKDGFKVMLISFDEDGLKTAANELETKYNVETKILFYDFRKIDMFDMLKAEINKLPSIACLVNNVGMSHSTLGRFSDADFFDDQYITDLLNCNVVSMLHLTRMVLPRMLGHPGTAIINLSSFTSMMPFPYLSLYASSKAFIRHFSESIALEFKDAGVEIQSVCPWTVATALSRAKQSSLFVPTPETFVATALDMLGVETVTAGYLPHALSGFVYSLIPQLIHMWLSKTYKRIKSNKMN